MDATGGESTKNDLVQEAFGNTRLPGFSGADASIVKL
jgi:hypothetical protein